MTTLHVIRHGKAMAGAENYDQLHADGAIQARLLGEYLLENKVYFDAVYSGPLVRQMDTLSHMRNAAGEVGAAWPQAVILAELAEAPLERLARHCMTDRIATDIKLQALVAELATRARAPDDSAFFEAVLAHVVGLWVSGEVTLPGVESAPEFGQRVRSALSTMLGDADPKSEKDRHVAVVTSNGVIGWLRGHVERDPEPERTCLLRRMFNASINRFRVEDDGLRLEAWNFVDHLTDRRLRTIL